jgi:ABC-type dipeptide/oligopeptide/nickel transport system permease subunit
MGNFLRENWIWIAAPIVLVVILVVALLVLGGGGDDSPFVYNIF